MLDNTTNEILKGLQELLIEEMDERLAKLKKKYQENPEDAGIPYDQGVIHGIDVAVQKIYGLMEG